MSHQEFPRREFLQQIGALALGACVTTPRPVEKNPTEVDDLLQQTEKEIQARTDQCERTLREQAALLPPDLTWMKEVAAIDVAKVRIYEGSPHLVIFARDVHVDGRMKEIIQFLQEAEHHGIRLVGLEGIEEGSIDAMRQRELSAKFDAFEQVKNDFRIPTWLEGTSLAAKLKSCTVIDITNFPEYRAPGRAYLRLMEEGGWTPTLLYGAENKELYMQSILSSQHRDVLRCLTALRCFTEETTGCDIIARTGEVPEKIRREHGDDIRLLIEQLEEIRRIIEQRINVLRDDADIQALNIKRGELAASSFTSALTASGENAGILIFGLGHTPEIERILDNRHISYVSIHARKSRWKDCQDNP